MNAQDGGARKGRGGPTGRECVPACPGFRLAVACVQVLVSVISTIYEASTRNQ